MKSLTTLVNHFDVTTIATEASAALATILETFAAALLGTLLKTLKTICKASTTWYLEAP